MVVNFVEHTSKQKETLSYIFKKRGRVEEVGVRASFFGLTWLSDI